MATRKKNLQSKPSQLLFSSSEKVIAFALALVVLIVGLLAFFSVTNSYVSKNKIDSKNNTMQKQQDLLKKSAGQKLQTNENPTQTPSQETQYVVKQDDSLWKISEQVYKDGYKWTEIAKANNLTTPDNLEVGAKLTLPKLTQTNETQPKATETKPNVTNPTTYVVQQGDNLWNISINYYGTGYKWYIIRDANREKVGLLPNGRPLIEPNTILVVPSG